MDLCFRNRNLMLVLSEFLAFMEAYNLSCVNQTLRKILQSDEIWWPLYFREYDYRIIDRKAGGAFLAFLYCKKHFAELQSFQCSTKVTLGILGSLSQLTIPDYMAKRHFDFFDIFSKPVIRKRSTYEITALSLPNADSLEYEKDYAHCFLLCLNSLSNRDLEQFQRWVAAFREQDCARYIVVVNQRGEVGKVPEIEAVAKKVPVVWVTELTEFEVNVVLSEILKVARRKEKGKVVEAVPEREEEGQQPTVSRKFRCQLV